MPILGLGVLLTAGGLGLLWQVHEQFTTWLCSCRVQPGCKCELASLQAPSQLSAQQTRTRPEIYHFHVPFSHLYWAFRCLQLREEISGDHLTPRHADTAQSELGPLACVSLGPQGITREMLAILPALVKTSIW